MAEPPWQLQKQLWMRATTTAKTSMGKLQLPWLLLESTLCTTLTWMCQQCDVKFAMVLRMPPLPPQTGRKAVLPTLIEDVLVDGVSLFIGLACAEQQKTPNQKILINLISNCVGSGPCMLQDFESLYNRLYPGFAYNVSVTTGSSLLENCRAVYITYVRHAETITYGQRLCKEQTGRWRRRRRVGFLPWSIKSNFESQRVRIYSRRQLNQEWM